MKSGRKVWTMRDGTKINVRDMTDSHLLNAIAMCERNSESFRSKLLMEAYSFSSMVQGEQAGYAIDDEISRLEDGEFDLYDESESYRNLVDEKDRRKL